MKISGVFFIFWPKNQKIESQNLGLILKKGLFKENIKIMGAHLRIYCYEVYQLITKLSGGYAIPKRQKIISKFKKKNPKILHFWIPLDI